MSNFHVGQKVVCVDAWRSTWIKKRFLGLFPYTKWYSELVEGNVYTIAHIFEGRSHATGDVHLGLVVAEVPEYPNSGFRASRFRPVIERKTDISVFTDMLNYQPKVVVVS